jgi:hypothetical protein
MKIQKILTTGKEILEGVKNNIVKSEHVEIIARDRMAICTACPFIDLEGSKCFVPGTQPCCSKCGCKLAWKTRSLSSSCGDEENPRWQAIVSVEEEAEIFKELDYDPNEGK